MRRLAPCLLLLMLAGCVAAGGGREAAESVPVDEVDRSCRVDADCEVKNIGNCCGYYPACVNRNSPTFPERVRARCEAEGMMSVCGFREISDCRCVEGRCEAQGAAANGALPVD